MQSVVNPTAVVLVTDPSDWLRQSEGMNSKLAKPVSGDTPGIHDYVTSAPVVAPPPRVCCTQRVVGVLIALGGVAIGVAGGVTFGVFYRTC